MKLEHIEKISDGFRVKTIYVDICDDLIAGLLLSQIIYWYKPDSEGKTKLRVKHDGHLWIAKRRTDWKEEIRISAKQYDRAIIHLQKMGFVETKVFKFGASTMVHIRLLKSNVEKAVDKHLHPELPKREIENSPKGKTGITERDIPSYTEITNRDYSAIANHEQEKEKDQEQKAMKVVSHLSQKIGVVPADKSILIFKFASHCTEEVLLYFADIIAENPRKPSHVYEKKIAAWCRHSPEQDIEKIKAFESTFNKPKQKAVAAKEFTENMFD